MTIRVNVLENCVVKQFNRHRLQAGWCFTTASFTKLVVAAVTDVVNVQSSIKLIEFSATIAGEAFLFIL